MMSPALEIIIWGYDYSKEDKDCVAKRTKQALYGFVVKRRRQQLWVDSWSNSVVMNFLLTGGSLIWSD